MRRKLLFIVLAVLLAAGIVIWRAPASLASSWLEKTQHPLQLNMTEGTLWNGSARQARWQGLMLGESNWQFKGINLAPFSLNYAIESNSTQFQVAGLVNAQPGGAVHAKELTGRMPAQWVDLQSFIPLVFLTVHLEWQWEYLDWPETGTTPWLQIEAAIPEIAAHH